MAGSAGSSESSRHFDVSITQLRTFNGPALVERCHRAWAEQRTMFLSYRDHLGLVSQVPILAARTVESSDGQVLFLWVRKKFEPIDPQI